MKKKPRRIPPPTKTVRCAGCSDWYALVRNNSCLPPHVRPGYPGLDGEKVVYANGSTSPTLVWCTPTDIPMAQCLHGRHEVKPGHACYCERLKGHPGGYLPHRCRCGTRWPDGCDPAIGYHAMPHRGGGCMLR